MTKSALIVGVFLATVLASVSTFAQPWMTAETHYGTFTLEPGFDPDPLFAPADAGGPDNPDALGAPETCTGMLSSAQPEIRIRVAAEAPPLSVFVNSTADTTLVINDPEGNWHCNNDDNGLNPRVHFDTPLSGQYSIWVGLWSSTEIVPSWIGVTELTATELTCEANGQSLPGDPGATHLVTCPSSCNTATIWGTDVYSDDSAVCMAAIHAGAISLEMGGTVLVTIADGLDSYASSTENGISSSDWGAWTRSFTVAGW